MTEGEGEGNGGGGGGLVTLSQNLKGFQPFGLGLLNLAILSL